MSTAEQLGAAAPSPPTQTAALKDELPGAVRTTAQLGISLLGTWTVALMVRFLLPRYLGPSLFGELNFCESFATGFMLVSTLGVDTYTMREVAVRPAHASDFFAGVHVVRAGLLVCLLGAMAGVLWARGKSLELQLTVLAWGVTQAITQLNGTVSTLLQAVARARRLAVANVVAKVSWGVGLAGLVLLRNTMAPLWMYVLPALAAELLKVALIFPAARAAVDLKLHVNIASTRKVLVSSMPFLVSTLAYSLSGPLNYWVLDVLNTDQRELGYYGATLNLVGLAMLFSPLVNWVLLPVLARAGTRSIEEVNRITAYALEAFSLAVIPIVLLVWLGADLWVQLAFGAAYAPATSALRIMVLMIVFTYAGILLANGLVARGHSWALSALSLFSVALAPGLGALIVPRFGHWQAAGGEAAGAALAVTLAEVVGTGLSLARMGKSVMPARLLLALTKALLVCALVVMLDRQLRALGHARLLLDVMAYVVLALGLRVVDVREVQGLIALVRQSRRAG